MAISSTSAAEKKLIGQQTPSTQVPSQHSSPQQCSRSQQAPPQQDCVARSQHPSLQQTWLSEQVWPVVTFSQCPFLQIPPHFPVLAVLQCWPFLELSSTQEPSSVSHFWQGSQARQHCSNEVAQAPVSWQQIEPPVQHPT
jgi:hypothetical protein